jgi:hypothetical protein
MQRSFLRTYNRRFRSQSEALGYFWDNLTRRMRQWEKEQERQQFQSVEKHLRPRAHVPSWIRLMLESYSGLPECRSPKPNGVEIDGVDGEGRKQWPRFFVGPALPKSKTRKDRNFWKTRRK